MKKKLLSNEEMKVVDKVYLKLLTVTIFIAVDLNQWYLTVLETHILFSIE